MVLHRSLDGDRPPKLSVTWGGSEGHPSCLYDPARQSVDATIAVDYEAPRHDTVMVTVTAYADENTSEQVGSGTGSVDVDGTVDTVLHIDIPVTKPPFVDEDGETACRLSVEH